MGVKMPPSTRPEWFGENHSHHPFRQHFQSHATQANDCKRARLIPPHTGLSACDRNFTFAGKIMKKLQHLFASVVLTLVLSASTFAGDGLIYPWVTEPTPTPTPVATTNNASAAEGIITTGVTSSDPVAEVALSLLQSVLALF
ncbi:MAG TPA: hypothetical protein VK363_14295 [Pyrinomonadaceae bacterium]|nr:hypothetical protein [Pyrinomonadaceae bacterium]